MAYMLQREGVEFYSYLVGYSTRKAVVDSETLCGLKLSYQSRYIFTENGTECASSCNITSAIYPLIKEPVKCRVRSDLRAKDLSNIRKFADGTNATVYLVEFEGKEVIMKMIKKTFENNRYVVAEFETERLILERSSHQNIIKIIGAGNDPRKFILLEYLNEGTLADILAKNQSQTKLGRIFFPRVTFSWPELLRRALELAEALKYLHEDCFKDSTIIHRDLKPDNIGFVDGKLKLFDMGLSICVAKSANPSDAFEMTGCTGTLRYMAPEVALNKPYSEKSDVYSYGIILWQMASDRIPFKRAGKTAFYECVVTDGLRPDLRTSWPKEFQGLLAACWQSDASKRPSFSKIQDILFSLQNAI